MERHLVSTVYTSVLCYRHVSHCSVSRSHRSSLTSLPTTVVTSPSWRLFPFKLDLKLPTYPMGTWLSCPSSLTSVSSYPSTTTVYFRVPVPSFNTPQDKNVSHFLTSTPVSLHTKTSRTNTMDNEWELVYSLSPYHLPNVWMRL